MLSGLLLLFRFLVALQSALKMLDTFAQTLGHLWDLLAAEEQHRDYE